MLFDSRKRLHWLFPIILALLLIGGTLAGMNHFAQAAPQAVDRFVTAAGSNTGPNDCTNSLAPCATIAHAIAMSGNSDTIKVGGGRYTETLIVTTPITISGGYDGSWMQDLTLNETVIFGNHINSVVTFLAGSDGAILDGVTLTGGHGPGGGVGGGATINDSSPVLNNLRVISNTTTGDGAGIYISGGGAAIYNSLIEDNQAEACCGGIHVGNSAQVVVTGTKILSNVANYAGGVGLFSSSVLTVEDSTISYNSSPDASGGAFELAGDLVSNVVLNLQDVVLSHNLTRDHGAALSASRADVYVTNGLIFANQSTSGNANVIAMGDSNITIMNSTIAENNPSGAQAVIVWSGGVFTITNSIMWNNALALQGDPPCPSCFSVTYSDIGGGWPGIGNVDVDPLFRDAGNEDYHLTFFSPVVDTGTAPGAPLHDLDGFLRDGSPDMGAYEFSDLLLFLPATVKEYVP